MEIQEVQLTGPKKLIKVTKKLTQPEDTDVVVKVVSCGICSSEFPVYMGQTMGKPGVSFRYAQYPCSLGHEVAGVIVAVGSEVKTLKVGDRVTGVPYRGSGFATHVVEPANMWVKVPVHIPLQHALGEPIMAVTNIVRMAEPDFFDSVVLIGDGFISLLVLSALSQYPLKHLILVGHHDDRLAIAKKCGATLSVNAKKEDPYWTVRRELDGSAHDKAQTPWPNGADIVMDFTGKMKSLQLCASLCKPKQRAKLVMAAFYKEEPFTLGHYLINRGPMLVPAYPAQSMDVTDDLQRGMTALERGIFPMERLVTHIFSLDEISLAIDTAIAREDGYIKGIVVPDRALLEKI